MMADFMLDGLARLRPAMSNAVPWAGEVRMIGRPSVTLTACSKSSSLTGIMPWSWYMATTASNSPWMARRNSVSAGIGPTQLIPCSWASRIAGLMIRCSSSPNWPSSPACGFKRRHADPRVLHAEAVLQRVIEQVDRLEHAADGELVADVGQRDVDRRQGHLQRPADEHHRLTRGLALARRASRYARARANRPASSLSC